MFTVSCALPEEREPALRLVFRHLTAEACRSRVDQALQMLARNEVDPDGLLVVRGGQGLAGALLCVPLAGASGLVWPPVVFAGPDQLAQEDQLLHAALIWLKENGAKLAQAILTSEEISGAPALLRHGFSHITAMQYYRHDLQQVPAPSPQRWRFVNFSDANRIVFGDTLAQTYEGSLDCPELTGKRTMDEIIAGHQAQGRFDPGRWWLALAGDRPVGVLLLTDLLDDGSWDLSYLGVIAEARRQGLGRALAQLAMSQAKAAGASQLVLAVDDRNTPAKNLYQSLGFQPAEQRQVFLCFLPPAKKPGNIADAGGAIGNSSKN